MTQPPRVTFFHAPQSRSGGTRALFEELGVEYDLHVLNLKANEQRQPAYLAINPMGKVPAIRHGEALVTEQPAVFLYLADLYPEAGLAPPLGDPLRLFDAAGGVGLDLLPADADTGLRLAPHAPGDVADALDARHRRAAEFHDDARHWAPWVNGRALLGGDYGGNKHRSGRD